MAVNRCLSFGLCVLFVIPGLAQVKEQPVGLLLSTGGAELLRAGTELALAARSGELLFPGDALRSGTGASTVLFCPDRSIYQVPAGAHLLFETGSLKVRSGALGAKTPAQSCILPQTVRVAVASQQHYGITMVRALLPAKPDAGSLASRLQDLPEADRQRIVAELEPVQKAIAANPDDLASQLAFAAVLESARLLTDSVAAYRTVASKWPDAVWVRGKIFELEQAAALAEAAKAARDPGGRTYALLVGVSEYQKLPKDQWLQYAHADANLFARHLKSPRGGGLQDSDVVVLLNEKATTAAIRNAFETFLKGRAGPKDTVVLFLAAHGSVGGSGNRGAYIVTWDTDTEDLATTSLPMADIHNLLHEGLSNVGRVLAFVDVCRAGAIGVIKNKITTVSAAVARMAEAEGEIFGLMASRPTEPSIEGPNFGGGHGAFSYFLVKGLAGAADRNGDGIVDVNEVIRYVTNEVADNTNDRQHPHYFAVIENTVALSDKRKPGIDVARFPVLRDHSGEPAALAASAAQLPVAEREALLRRFRESVARAPRDAVGELPRLKQSLPPEAYLAAENELRIALEDRGQQVILRYLTGDQVPQTRAAFESGAEYFRAARELTPESLFLEAREVFCRGRAELFGKDYSGSADLLERAARLDPTGAYSYNALGIAYLEQADYVRAIAAFRDATARAPYWAYPRHNLALALAEVGRYRDAVASYRDAIRLAPRYWYLPYNLGLLHQRLNRRREAEQAYRSALSIAPDAPEILTAMGVLRYDAGRVEDAERYYRQALQQRPDFAPARHNLALLLAETPSRRAEAFDLWRANLAKPADYFPSRLALAESLAAAGHTADAVEQYRIALAEKPEYTSARLAMAELLAKTGDLAAAIAQLSGASAAQPRNALIPERIGDLEQQRGRAAEAAKAWKTALQRATAKSDRKRISRKLKAQGAAGC